MIMLKIAASFGLLALMFYAIAKTADAATPDEPNRVSEIAAVIFFVLLLGACLCGAIGMVLV